MMPLLHGMVTMGFIIAGLYFLRFWRRTKDQLFIVFALAFWLLAIHEVLLALTGGTDSEQDWVFLPSLGAFGLLILAILIKNFGGADKSG